MEEDLRDGQTVHVQLNKKKSSKAKIIVSSQVIALPENIDQRLREPKKNTLKDQLKLPARIRV